MKYEAADMLGILWWPEQQMMKFSEKKAAETEIKNHAAIKILCIYDEKM